MKILVVTPTLGESSWLTETVASVSAFQETCQHLLVAPPAKVPALSTKFSGIAVVPERGGGMYAAINSGLAASADWDAFTYLNDDDVLLPDFAAAILAIIKSGASERRIAYGGVRLINATGRRLGAIPVSPAPAINRLLYAQRLEPIYQHGTIATRAVVETIGVFDESLRYCGDSEFLARACVRGVPFVRATGREVAAFRLRSGQLTKNRPSMIAERASVDEKLGLTGPQSARALRLARWRFRLANLAIYIERIRRHGFITFDELLAKSV